MATEALDHGEIVSFKEFQKLVQQHTLYQSNTLNVDVCLELKSIFKKQLPYKTVQASYLRAELCQDLGKQLANRLVDQDYTMTDVLNLLSQMLNQ